MIKIDLLDQNSTSLGRNVIFVEVPGPVTIGKLFTLAGKQEKIGQLSSELNGFMIYHHGVLLQHKEGLKSIVKPGDEIMLIPPISGG